MKARQKQNEQEQEQKQMQDYQDMQDAQDMPELQDERDEQEQDERTLNVAQYLLGFGDRTSDGVELLRKLRGQVRGRYAALALQGLKDALTGIVTASSARARNAGDVWSKERTKQVKAWVTVAIFGKPSENVNGAWDELAKVADQHPAGPRGIQPLTQPSNAAMEWFNRAFCEPRMLNDAELDDAIHVLRWERKTRREAKQ